MKIVESLTPFHRKISDAIFYCTDLIIILCFNFNKIVNDSNKYSKAKFALDFFNFLICFFSSLIYLEIVEINFCNLNYNLRENIIMRGICYDSDDSHQIHLDKRSLLSETDINSNESDNNTTTELSSIYS